MKGERHMLQSEHDRVQGEHKRFWKGGKEGSKGWEKRMVKKTLVNGEKKGAPESASIFILCSSPG